MASPFTATKQNGSGQPILSDNTWVNASAGPVRGIFVGQTATLASGSVTITLPNGLSFDTSTSYAVMVTQNATSAVSEYFTVTTQAATSFVIKSSNASSSATVAWVAIGF